MGCVPNKPNLVEKMKFHLRVYRRMNRWLNTHYFDRYIMSFGWGKKCSICKWKGGRFLPFCGVQNVLCPICGSHNRHRFYQFIFQEKNFNMERVLHFAPENCLRPNFNKAKHYVSIDLSAHNVSVAGNVLHLPFPSNAFDFIFCSHVLEHVKEVDFAISEIYRILNFGGVALLAVPIWPQDVSECYENVRESEYYHWWRPGRDWFSKYTDAGFNCQIIDPSQYNCKRYGLIEGWDQLALCRK